MESTDQVSAESAWLHRLFSPGPARVSLTDGTIHFEGRIGDIRAKISVGAIGTITVSPSWFWHRLTIRLTDGTEWSIGGLDRSEASLIRDAALEEAARVHEAAVAEAVRNAKALSPSLTRLDEELRQLFAGDRYARYRDSLKLHEAVGPALRECEGRIREYLEQEAREALGRLESLEPVESFEAARRKANSLFVSNQASSVQAAALKAMPNPLTNEQAKSVATDEDVTRVLAGAGTGKTSVVVGKIAHLVRNQGVSPDDILVLAFNKKAVEEIKERLTGDLTTTHVRTFHSFGSRVIAQVEG
ncbi:MAG: UvrD-helicase domain-containing protein, partial [Chloroflexota bacterium]|nr:UvrD-helicase domain-containing protein [Chloroflexota bacterium]